MARLQSLGRHLFFIGSAMLLGLAVVGVEAVEDEGGTVRGELRVSQYVGHPLVVFLSARAEGGNWGHDRLLLLEETNKRGTYRYSDRTAAIPVGDLTAYVNLRVWQRVSDPLRVYLSARPAGGTWGATERLSMDKTDDDGSLRYSDRTLVVPTPVPLDEDVAALLAWRDTIAGTATLNWSRSRAVSSWTGVTVAGTPQRVTKLELANGGLTGELSGLMGELTGLTELHLDGNALTGRIPSKVALLNGLTHTYLGGNTLTGCAPPSIRMVPNNDLATLGLPDCAAGAVDVRSHQEPTVTAGTYQFIWPGYRGQFDSPLIFDVPEGLEVELVLVSGDGGGRGLVFEDAATGRFWIGVDVDQGIVYGRGVAPASGEADGAPAEEAALVKLFDRLAESVWLDEDCLVATVNQCDENRE